MSDYRRAKAIKQELQEKTDLDLKFFAEDAVELLFECKEYVGTGANTEGENLAKRLEAFLTPKFKVGKR
jgi:hypothetical protein